jgi:predicted secreted protein
MPKDSRIELAVKAGCTFELTQAYAASTGYRYSCSGSSDGKVVELISERQEPPPPSMPDAPGRLVWTLRALAPGDALVTVLALPPDHNVEPHRVVHAIHVG